MFTGRGLAHFPGEFNEVCRPVGWSPKVVPGKKCRSTFLAPLWARERLQPKKSFQDQENPRRRSRNVDNGPPVNALEGFTPRRTVYVAIDRMDLPGLLRSFDYPDPTATSPARDMTTVAPQALFFMNNEFTVECARRLINRPDVGGLADQAERVDRIYQIVIARRPDDVELALACDYLQKHSHANEAERWVDLAHALLMSNEFLFVD